MAPGLGHARIQEPSAPYRGFGCEAPAADSIARTDSSKGPRSAQSLNRLGSAHVWGKLVRIAGAHQSVRPRYGRVSPIRALTLNDSACPFLGSRAWWSG